MSTLHKHAEFLRAIADGLIVEGQPPRGAEWAPWVQVTHLGTLDIEGYMFRIKPHRWQKEIDAQKAGKKIQVRHVGSKIWSGGTVEVAPFLGHPFEYRVKPDTLRYRVGYAKSRHGLFALVAMNERETSSWETDPAFVKWIGDWQEAEVPT